MAGKNLVSDVKDSDSKEKLASSGDVLTKELLESFSAGALAQIRLPKSNSED